MKKEIGSEFWSIPVSEDNSLFPENTKWFISGRAALQAIINENEFHTVALPEWCCESMIVPFVRKGIETLFYFDRLPKTDCALVMDYFGYSSDRIITEGYKGTVIRDLTHSIFSKRYEDADYYFGSLRKWAGFYTGGFGWGFKREIEYNNESLSYSMLRKKAMNMKRLYIEEKTDSKDYLRVFEEAEELLADCGIFPAEETDVQAAKTLDIDSLKQRRRRNAAVLIDGLRKYTIYPSIKDDDCPMFVPIRIRNREGLRKYLIDHQIYCPVHWPISQYHTLIEDHKKIYAEEISLVCDQRYDEEDMLRIVNTVLAFIKEDECNA